LASAQILKLLAQDLEVVTSLGLADGLSSMAGLWGNPMVGLDPPCARGFLTLLLGMNLSAGLRHEVRLTDVFARFC
jgi:hypothetical protein